MADPWTRYAGPPPTSRTRYHWTVRVWDDTGTASAWAAPQWFEAGLLEPGDWSAQWITRATPAVAADQRGADPRTSQLRHAFTLRGPVARARLYATALGDYELALNGQEVGDDWFTPGWTDYRRRVQYQTYDVTALLVEGPNALGAILSTGWYAGNVSNIGKNTYGSDRPGLLVQLEVDYADGGAERIVSDLSWRTVEGPVLGADHQDGEHYDARLETPGWTEPGFDDTGWDPVVAKTDVPEAMVLSAQADPPARVTERIAAVEVVRRSGDVQVVDLGQNLVGVVELELRGAPSGTVIQLRHAEALDADGDLATANLRAAQATDSYVAAGRAVERWHPRFTFHGFRYVEVTGWPGDLAPDAITGLVVGTDVPLTGTLTTSDPRLDQLHANVVWSLRGNVLSVVTDCPQRDERMGWTGDLNVFAPTATFLADMRRFLGGKWLADVRDEQAASGAVGVVVPDPVGQFSAEAPLDLVWPSAAIHVPHTLWQAYGDTAVIEESWDVMAAFMAFWEARTPSVAFGDWAPPPPDPEDNSVGAAQPQLDPMVAVAWFKHDADLMAAMAAATGRDAEAEHYRAVAEEAAAEFEAAFVESQVGYALALAFDLLPPGEREAAAATLATLVEEQGDGWDLATGFVGTPELLGALSEHGQLDAAYELLLQDDYPSWLYAVDRGATTTWEFWNGLLEDGSMHPQPNNSLNHYAVGAVADWLHRTIGGIVADPAAPGYGHVLIRPRPGGGLTSGGAELATVRGTIATSWRLVDGAFELDLTIPPTATATVHLPNDELVEVGSGTHHLRVPA